MSNPFHKETELVLAGGLTTMATVRYDEQTVSFLCPCTYLVMLDFNQHDDHCVCGDKTYRVESIGYHVDVYQNGVRVGGL